MNDLVERLREIGAHYSACDRQQTIYEAADALEAAKARIEAVRREAIAECAQLVEERAKDRITLFSDRSREPHEIKAIEAQHNANLIRGLADESGEKQ